MEGVWNSDSCPRADTSNKPSSAGFCSTLARRGSAILRSANWRSPIFSAPGMTVCSALIGTVDRNWLRPLLGAAGL